MSLASDNPGFSGFPPLALYVHLPWCVRKCPYCDFNSHQAITQLPVDQYVAALLKDLENDLPLVWGRSVQSIFFGGGTPSLFSAAAIGRILDGVRARLRISPQAEITMEANPGTTEYDSFSAYRDAGINRVSLGAQSFNDRLLQRLGRIHGRMEIERALASIRSAGIDNFNLDLMYGLPGQSTEEALDDVRQALDQGPAHLSYYQLTLEPHTAFYADPPDSPDEDSSWEIAEQSGELIRAAGFQQYEISAWADKGKRCQHNLNYWCYGDFLGIGAGAHSKITLPAEQAVRRRIKQMHPKTYLQAMHNGQWLAEDRLVEAEERKFEFFLNQLRLCNGVQKKLFTAHTGLAWENVSRTVDQAIENNWMIDNGDVLRHTELGWRFCNELQALFLPESL